MTKLLNLNQLSNKETREVQIGETTYKVKDMSVEDFIETSKVAQDMENETSYAVQIGATVSLIQRSIPTIEKSLLLNLSLEQLQALASFIRGEDPETIMARSLEPLAEPVTEGEAGNV